MRNHLMTRRAFLKRGGAVVVAMSVGPLRARRVAAQTVAGADRFLGKTVATVCAATDSWRSTRTEA